MISIHTDDKRDCEVPFYCFNYLFAMYLRISSAIATTMTIP